MENLNSDLLRSFLAIAQTGSVTEGARQVHRSQSAVSLQLKRLESILGRPVFERHGRGVALTTAGQNLLPVAQEVTERLDTALRLVRADGLEGKIRLGIPDDHSRLTLSRIIGAFSQLHPLVDLDVTCAISTGFPEALAKGRLDLAVFETEKPTPAEEILFEDETVWVTSPHHDVLAQDPLPVALFDQECWWRDAALNALRARGKPYRIVYSSQSVAGVSAAIEAGIAVGLMGRSTLEPGLRVLEDAGFGPTPSSKLVMAAHTNSDTAPMTAMKSAIRAAFDSQPVYA